MQPEHGDTARRLLALRRRFDDAINLIHRLMIEAQSRGDTLVDLDAPNRATDAYETYYELESLVEFLTELRSRETG